MPAVILQLCLRLIFAFALFGGLALTSAHAQTSKLSGLSGITNAKDKKASPPAKAANANTAKPEQAKPLTSMAGKPSKAMAPAPLPAAALPSAKKAKAASGGAQPASKPPKLTPTAAAKAKATPPPVKAAPANAPKNAANLNTNKKPSQPLPSKGEAAAKTTYDKAQPTKNKASAKHKAAADSAPSKSNAKGKAAAVPKAAKTDGKTAKTGGKAAKDASVGKPNSSQSPADSKAAPQVRAPKGNDKAKAPKSSSAKKPQQAPASNLDHFESDGDDTEPTSPLALVVSLFVVVCCGIYLYMKKRNQVALASDLGVTSPAKSDIFDHKPAADDTQIPLGSLSQNPLNSSQFEAISSIRKGSLSAQRLATEDKSAASFPEGEIVGARKAAHEKSAATSRSFAKEPDSPKASFDQEDRPPSPPAFLHIKEPSKTDTPQGPDPLQQMASPSTLPANLASALEPVHGISLETFAMIMAREASLATQDPEAFIAVYADYNLDANSFDHVRQTWTSRMNNADEPTIASIVSAEYGLYLARASAQQASSAAPRPLDYASRRDERLDGAGEPCSFEQFVELMAAQECLTNQGKDFASALQKHFQLSLEDFSKISQFWSQKYITNALLKNRYDELEPQYKQKWHQEAS